MAGLSIPPDFPLSELLGQELSNLSIGLHFLRMSFIRIKLGVAGTPKYEDGAAIELEHGFEFQAENGLVTVEDNADLASGAASLIPLLGKTIIAVQREPSNELSLQFSDGTTILLKTDPQGFESYHLHMGEESIAVTRPF